MGTAVLAASVTGQEERGSELGYVSHVAGTWLIAGDTVRLYRRISEEDSLSVVFGSAVAPAAATSLDVTPSLAVVAMTGQRIRFLCDAAEACSRPLVPADSLERSSGLLAFAGRIVQAVGSLIEREKPDVVSTISRGGPQIQEAVVATEDGTLSLQPVLAGLASGTYRIVAYRLVEIDRPESDPRLSAEIAWDPARASSSSIQAPRVDPGLYQIDVSTVSGLFSPVSTAWALVVEAVEAEPLQQRLAEAVAITEGWSGEPPDSEVRAFLRVYLRHLADSTSPDSD
ncbi:MAG: hypothetical protein JSV95_10975 [Gemmatimonadota bacterium]|nr:MAG: hypothetical protein JSV95_10975 [Gemmatimonadota bacterium]